MRCVVLMMSLALAAASARAEVVSAGPADDVEGLIGGLQAGDELVLADGVYTLDERFLVSLTGTAESPIIIRAADGARPHFMRPEDNQNIWDIEGEHLVIRGIEFSGGSAGLRFMTASFITIEDCEIHDTGDVALRANDSGTYDSFRILRNNIHHTNNTGEGMYLGCNNDDGCRLANSLIEGNYVHHTNQASVTQGDGIEIKEGGYGNVIRDNVIHDTKYPCLLTYSAVGNGSPNIIEGNVMWNCGDHAIQTAADAVIRNNVILGSGSNGIAMQPHQSGDPTNLMVVHNTVVHPQNDAIRVSGAVGEIVIANNAVFAPNGRAISVAGDGPFTVVGNVGSGELVGVADGLAAGDLSTDVVDADLSGAPPMNVFPAAGGALVGAGDPRFVTEVDFNGTARNGS
ncbi:MAG: right-handed parallel beta-helix repeat-containing protein, partial [Deltaproteobacteria bacterium]|nr:right-handed parallel beta-helix repeat-containing protein [Deltaproteobacteria bacterium]